MPEHEDIVDLSGPRGGERDAVGDAETDSPEENAGGRRFLRLYFRCANQYTRAYLNAEGTGYLGTCPQCGKCMRFTIGPGGTSERFFEVSC